MIAPGNGYIAVLDTCVLAPMPLCDTLRRMGYSAEQASRRIDAMEAAFEDAGVTGYEELIGTMTNDVKDRHVLAAAVRCGAHAVVTQNVRHFPAESARMYDLEVLTPDAFLVHQFHVNHQLLRQRLEAQAEALGGTMDALLNKLARFAPACVQLLL